ncbi:transcriptional regulator [Streptomyces spinoverrucosus]|uniref:Transcriptional regulator n=1 Tax=Streptomyces spinoverrucosus TaxID=284043 RepID=A0A4Y3VTD6_9ACTN|nr:transcriptional regulator [Streptomyces spinoverrucosus]GHB97847.1 transcriptional regulator [Streptomyces spinoverrucosus]
MVGLLVVAAVTGAGSAVWAYYKLNGNLTTADISGLVGDDRPPAVSTKALNIALIGSDSRKGLDGQYGTGLTSAQSDTLMVLHLSADRKRATVVSVPRDSWVEIPSCDLGDGERSKPHSFKINEAFALGSADGGVAGGAACTIRTLEHNTGLRIDHFVEVNFAGFKDMVNALGGVKMCLEEPVKDTKAHLDLPAGCQTIKDEDALAYVRARYSLGDGSDIGRIGRQQEFLQALADKARSKLFDPAALYAFLDAATKSLTTDTQLGSLSKLTDLAKDLKSVPRDQLTFVTVPNVPRSTVEPSDQANVIWKKPQAQKLFTALARDEPVDADSVSAPDGN